MRTLGSELPTKDISRPLTSQGLSKRLMKWRHRVSLSPLTTYDDSDDECISHSNHGWQQPRVIVRFYIRGRHVWKCVKFLVMTAMSCQETFQLPVCVPVYRTNRQTVLRCLGHVTSECYWVQINVAVRNTIACLAIWIGYGIAVCFYI